MQGDSGRPRPALVAQADGFGALVTVTVLRVTGHLGDAPLPRITMAPDARDGLSRPSQVRVDKAMTVRHDKVGPAFGTADDALMLAVGRAMAVFLGIA